jgi:hypothetical protein
MVRADADSSTIALVKSKIGETGSLFMLVLDSIKALDFLKGKLFACHLSNGILGGCHASSFMSIYLFFNA